MIGGIKMRNPESYDRFIVFWWTLLGTESNSLVLSKADVHSRDCYGYILILKTVLASFGGWGNIARGRKKNSKRNVITHWTEGKKIIATNDDGLKPQLSSWYTAWMPQTFFITLYYSVKYWPILQLRCERKIKPLPKHLKMGAAFQNKC